KYTAQDATTAQKGIVQLSSATNSTSETLAATSKAVKAVMDETNKKAPLN
ncbi:phage tail protein, partial [Escherichia coli]